MEKSSEDLLFVLLTSAKKVIWCNLSQIYNLKVCQEAKHTKHNKCTDQSIQFRQLLTDLTEQKNWKVIVAILEEKKKEFYYKRNIITFDPSKQCIYTTADKWQGSTHESMQLREVKELIITTQFTCSVWCPGGRPTFFLKNKQGLEKKFLGIYTCSLPCRGSLDTIQAAVEIICVNVFSNLTVDMVF